jgi:hypothetical protein
MTLASKVALLAWDIQECLELIEAAYLNFALSESEVMEEVAYYEGLLVQYRDHKAALEVWL